VSRRLKTIARDIINSLPVGWRTVLEEGYCNTDRIIKTGGRNLRHPGKGRHGTRLLVYRPDGSLALDHNAAETYRSNDEVEVWLASKNIDPTKRGFRELSEKND
jgi:hypothetical protein